MMNEFIDTQVEKIESLNRAAQETLEEQKDFEVRLRESYETTLRDQFAGQAMQCLLRNLLDLAENGKLSAEDYAEELRDIPRQAYSWAERMLEARKL